MIYVMSDIHGNRRRFRSVMDQINLQPDDTLYVLGDVVDRFPDGIAILRELMRMPNVRMLLGNHEYMMQQATDPQERSGSYWENMDLWYNNGGEVTEKALMALNQDQRDEIYDYLRELPLSYEIEVNGTEYLLIHGAPMEWYSAYEWKYMSKRQYTVWHRWKLTEKLDGDRIVIFGHTPTCKYDPKPDPMRIFYGDHRIDIDCGSGFPVNANAYGYPRGRLACLRLDDMREFYSEEFYEVRTYSEAEMERFWNELKSVRISPWNWIDTEFLWFRKRTQIKTIYNWFDEHYPGGVEALKHGKENITAGPASCDDPDAD